MTAIGARLTSPGDIELIPTVKDKCVIDMIFIGMNNNFDRKAR